MKSIIIGITCALLSAVAVVTVDKLQIPTVYGCIVSETKAKSYSGHQVGNIGYFYLRTKDGRYVIQQNIMQVFDISEPVTDIPIEEFTVPLTPNY